MSQTFQRKALIILSKYVALQDETSRRRTLFILGGKRVPVLATLELKIQLNFTTVNEFVIPFHNLMKRLRLSNLEFGIKTQNENFGTVVEIRYQGLKSETVLSEIFDILVQHNITILRPNP